MKSVDWSYHRPACVTCKKTQDFFATNGVQVKEEVNARKVRLGRTEALNLTNQAQLLFVVRGKNVLRFDLKKNRPSDEELLKLIIGPTGNLRAPAFLVGKKLVVGFNEDMYRQLS